MLHTSILIQCRLHYAFVIYTMYHFCIGDLLWMELWFASCKLAFLLLKWNLHTYFVHVLIPSSSLFSYPCPFFPFCVCFYSPLHSFSLPYILILSLPSFSLVSSAQLIDLSLTLFPLLYMTSVLH